MDESRTDAWFFDVQKEWDRPKPIPKCDMAERRGFEPPVELPLRRFSKPLP
jgi:hypothetical protein